MEQEIDTFISNGETYNSKDLDTGYKYRLSNKTIPGKLPNVVLMGPNGELKAMYNHDHISVITFT